MIKAVTRVVVGVGLCVLLPSHVLAASSVKPTLDWPLPFFVTVWIVAAGILAVVGWFGRKK